MAQDYDIVDRLEKQIEGSNLALAAVAEVLHKMDSRISKAEEQDFELAQQDEDAVEKQEIIKAVASEVYGLIKADNGMEGTDGDAVRKAKSIGKGDDDSEKAVTPVSTIKDQQATIQAMQKQLNLLKQGMDDEEFPNEDEDEDAQEENGEEEEDNEDEDKEGMEYSQGYPVLENMQKQIDSLKSQLAGTFDMQKAVQNETEGRLRKMGFREETSLTRPTQIRYADSMGVDGTAPITKATEGGDVVDQMMQLSYQDLRRLQENIESGDTEGVPRELLG
jgi:hypothetical protein